MPRKPAKRKSSRGDYLQVRLTDDEKEAFAEAAGRQHLSMSAWIRRLGMQAAEREKREGAA